MNLPKRSKKRQAMIDSGAYQPPKRKPMKRTAFKAKRKPTGEAALFLTLWNNLPHECEVCKVYIHEAKASNFSHLLNKGTYPEFRLDPRNVRLHCERCHDLWHKHGPEALQWSTGWTKVCAIYFALRDAARGIT